MELLEYWNQSHSRPEKKPKYDGWLDKYKEYLIACNEPIIDLGCGLGNNTLYLLERNYCVISCDLSEVALSRLQSFIPTAETRLFDMREGIPFDDSSVKIVIADLSLHYFSDEDTFKVLEELNRVLEVEGLLICRVNSTKNLIDSACYYLDSGGLLRRYFDEVQIDYFFNNERWENIYKDEYIMTRYSTNKVVWEISMKKKYFT
ncbi:class I SAM-dependent methyltransferase [Paenibacillus sp. PR3]|uniref:Class I SAM-dependent methyltransferase n=1 Tax=Paenibacillus terricola TaxID=2763503 RepID=A0ABR8MRI5_9BACL|nr:class I SAM-dependent methyltransferase [Paenibacillus terricola]MBD3918605.1 class I SAM-dependent methyltransferase [Paenibacillus terricola]